MGQRNADRRWPIPPRTRKVWVHRNSGPHDAPLQGYVISFRRESYRWRALVLVAISDETATQA